MTITQYVGVTDSLKDDANYMMGKQVTNNVDIAYYFPLRNEKNSFFLINQIQYLEEEYRKASVKANLSKTESLMFDHMSQNIIRDIQVIRKRLIELGVLLSQASLGERKTELLENMSSNIETNTKCKMMMLDNASQAGSAAYTTQLASLYKDESRRVVY